MQVELDAQALALPVHILGINAVGYELSSSGFVEGTVLPWLQDTQSEDVWTTWAVDYRDVVILDDTGRLEAFYNLTEHDLAEGEHYDALKALLVAP